MRDPFHKSILKTVLRCARLAHRCCPENSDGGQLLHKERSAKGADVSCDGQPSCRCRSGKATPVEVQRSQLRRLTGDDFGVTREGMMMPHQPRATTLLAVDAVKAIALVFLLLPLEGCFCGQVFRQSNDIVGLSISPLSASIQPGNTQQFSATGTFGTGSTGDVTTQVAWSSSDPAIATINGAGLATAKSYGTVTVSGTCQCYRAETALSISNQTVTPTSTSLSPANTTIGVGHTQQFIATANYSNGKNSVITSSAMWTSSDGTIATVSSGGLATGISPGTVTITTGSGNITDSTNLTVQ